MTVGVFGKLPAKRDFVQNGLSTGLMNILDPWLQAAVAQSRDQLGENWLNLYLIAPIWRFWMGNRVAGNSVMGAMMPSVDGVGRYFPLCIIGEFDHPVPPPDVNDHGNWFFAVEGLMLDTLSDNATYENLLHGVQSLPDPDRGPSAETDAFGLLRSAHAQDLYGGYSIWWTAEIPDPDSGNTSYMPIASRAMMHRGLPQPYEFTTMITNDPAHNPGMAVGGA
ncbi:MAG: type VI secretion system-associated protein TagF [Pseudomonadota bacterium]